MNDRISEEVSLPENDRKFFYRAGAVLLLLLVGGIVGMSAGSSSVLYYVFAAMMCSGVLLGLAFLYESLEPHKRLVMRLCMYGFIGFFASLYLLTNPNFGFLALMAIFFAPVMILGSIDLLCYCFAQRTAAGLSQGGDLAQDPLAEPLLNPTATDSAVLGAAQTQEAAAGLSQGRNSSQDPLAEPLLNPTATGSAAPGAVPVPVPVPANQAGATSNLFGQPADQEGRPDSTIELTPQKPNP